MKDGWDLHGSLTKADMNRALKNGFVLVYLSNKHVSHISKLGHIISLQTAREIVHSSYLD